MDPQPSVTDPEQGASPGSSDVLRHPVFLRLLLPVAILTFYFLVPLGSGDAPAGAVGGILVGVGCAGLILWAVVQELRRADRLRPVHLIIVLEVALVAFALTYVAMAMHSPGEFSGLETRLDGLYFSLTTMSTVGYGDIHAAGQAGRLVVTIQLAFNLVFVGGLIALIQEQVRERRKQSQRTAPPDALSP